MDKLEFLWYVSFGLTIIISPMRHIGVQYISDLAGVQYISDLAGVQYISGLAGVQYISDLAVCDRPEQAAYHSPNPQFGLKVLQ